MITSNENDDFEHLDSTIKIFCAIVFLAVVGFIAIIVGTINYYFF